MLRPAVTLIILLFLKMPQGQGCPGSTSDVVGLSGQSLQLQPKITQMKIYSVVWKRQLSSPSAYQHILSWENGSKPKNESLTWTIFNNKFSFRTENLTLLINTAQEQDSGSYCLEVTNESGRVWTAKFQVSVFDRVEKPHLQEQEKVLDRGRCQVSLYCLVSRDRNVTYSWYRGSKFIHKARNLTYLKEEIDNNMYTYTCNVSNPVSWNSHSLNLTASCQSVQQEFRFWPLLVTIVIVITLLLGILTCLCMWKRKRKQPETSPEECLTIYEDVKDLKTTRNHKQKPKQNSPEKKSTIYSMIQPQSSVPTSQDVSNTLYSFIQPSRKVGNREPKAQNPAQLSHKELESFAVYS
ncbi:natural killer cell receptor 2B4 isoform X2 [Nycticebus coucang]|uniref:natural killer cell receptor 2B4 isoform X2 n=1 Tax=Nycticebus coucang TaxID=9470 RepID=UPI00234DC0FD|nr:natural killer cell receptor 2B4 isoform X2 [Nycticebus coucang]